MTTRLKPCPFCGGDGAEINDFRRRGRGYAIECLDCHAVTKPCRESGDAISAWNDRAGEEQAEESARQRKGPALPFMADK